MFSSENLIILITSYFDFCDLKIDLVFLYFSIFEFNTKTTYIVFLLCFIIQQNYALLTFGCTWFGCWRHGRFSPLYFDGCHLLLHLYGRRGAYGYRCSHLTGGNVAHLHWLSYDARPHLVGRKHRMQRGRLRTGHDDLWWIKCSFFFFVSSQNHAVYLQNWHQNL